MRNNGNCRKYSPISYISESTRPGMSLKVLSIRMRRRMQVFRWEVLLELSRMLDSNKRKIRPLGGVRRGPCAALAPWIAGSETGHPALALPRQTHPIYRSSTLFLINAPITHSKKNHPKWAKTADRILSLTKSCQ